MNEHEQSHHIEPPAVHTEETLALMGQEASQVTHDAYDLATWKMTRETYQRLQQAVNEASKRLKTAPLLLRDLFWSFYKAAPSLSEAPQSPLGSIHRQIVEQVMQTNEWEEMRATGSVHDPVISAMGTIALSQKLLESLDQQTIDHLNQMQAIQQEIRQLLDQAEGLQTIATSFDGAQAERLASLAQGLEAEASLQAAALGQMLPAVQQQMRASERVIRSAARTGLRQSLQERGTLGGAIDAYGAGIGAGGMAIKEKMELAHTIGQSKKLKDIAALCGKLKAFANAVQQAKLEETPEQIDGITIGRQLSRLIPSELALLADEAAEWLFAKKWVEGQLLQYDLHCYRMQGQGPIIMALDSSGSMHDQMDGLSKEVWSKAVAMALVAIAHQQERDIAIIHFSHQITSYQRFKRGVATVSELVGCCEHFHGGGTAFEPWMRKALELIDTAEFDRADVICISDGLTNIGSDMVQQWNTRRRERGMRTFGILLGEDEEECSDLDEDESQEEAATFRRMTDVYIPLSQLSDETQIEAIFAI